MRSKLVRKKIMYGEYFVTYQYEAGLFERHVRENKALYLDDKGMDEAMEGRLMESAALVIITRTIFYLNVSLGLDEKGILKQINMMFPWLKKAGLKIIEMKRFEFDLSNFMTLNVAIPGEK
jgi:hypothetical protein